MFVARRERLIEWGDCDPARIVFNPRYFEWFDGCTAHVFASAGFPKESLFERYGFAGWPLVETRAEFLKPCRFGETVIIKVPSSHSAARVSTSRTDSPMPASSRSRRSRRGSGPSAIPTIRTASKASRCRRM